MNRFIDFVGASNLSCPSCRMGNSDNHNVKHAMHVVGTKLFDVLSIDSLL